MENTTNYCKTKCNNVIQSKNNVYSTNFSNTSSRMRQSALLTSKSPSVTSGVIIYGDLIPKEINDTNKQYYVMQSLSLLMKLRR